MTKQEDNYCGWCGVDIRLGKSYKFNGRSTKAPLNLCQECMKDIKLGYQYQSSKVKRWDRTFRIPVKP